MSGDTSCSLGSLLQFSSVLMLAGEGEEREEVGDILGKRLWPGEKRDAALAPLTEGGWKAEGKDFRM